MVGEGGEALAQLRARHGAGIQADGEMGVVGALADFRAVSAERRAQRIQLPAGIGHAEEGRAGEAVQAADLQLERTDIQLAQSRELGGEAFDGEIIVEPGGFGREPADEQGDMRLAPVVDMQPVAQVCLRPRQPRQYPRAVHGQRPHRVALAPAAPLRVVAPLADDALRRGVPRVGEQHRRSAAQASGASRALMSASLSDQSPWPPPSSTLRARLALLCCSCWIFSSTLPRAISL
ncbi:hypothetical protein D3C78_1295850 [compost metagenome]